MQNFIGSGIEFDRKGILRVLDGEFTGYLLFHVEVLCVFLSNSNNEVETIANFAPKNDCIMVKMRVVWLESMEIQNIGIGQRQKFVGVLMKLARES